MRRDQAAVLAGVCILALSGCANGGHSPVAAAPSPESSCGIQDGSAPPGMLTINDAWGPVAQGGHGGSTTTLDPRQCAAPAASLAAANCGNGFPWMPAGQSRLALSQLGVRAIRRVELVNDSGTAEERVRETVLQFTSNSDADPSGVLKSARSCAGTSWQDGRPWSEFSVDDKGSTAIAAAGQFVVVVEFSVPPIGHDRVGVLSKALAHLDEW